MLIHNYAHLQKNFLRQIVPLSHGCHGSVLESKLSLEQKDNNEIKLKQMDRFNSFYHLAHESNSESEGILKTSGFHKSSFTDQSLNTGCLRQQKYKHKYIK